MDTVTEYRSRYCYRYEMRHLMRRVVKENNPDSYYQHVDLFYEDQKVGGNACTPNIPYDNPKTTSAAPGCICVQGIPGVQPFQNGEDEGMQGGGGGGGGERGDASSE